MSQNNGMVCTFRDLQKQINELNAKVNSSSNDIALKTINHESIKGEGNIDIQAYVTANEAYPEDWLDGVTTMAGLIAKINDDPNAVPGKIYLSTVSFSDLPANMMFAEVKAEIMTQGQYGKVILFTVTSSNVAPYHWEYTSTWRQTGTWRAFQVADNKESEAFLLSIIEGNPAASAEMKSYLQSAFIQNPGWLNLWSQMGLAFGFSYDEGSYYTYMMAPASAESYNDYKVAIQTNASVESDQVSVYNLTLLKNETTNYTDEELEALYEALIEGIPVTKLVAITAPVENNQGQKNNPEP